MTNTQGWQSQASVQAPGSPPAGAAETFFGKRSNQVDDWLAIQADGSITAFSGKVELGTGVRTALTQIVAEELDVAFQRVNTVMGDTALTPDEGYTAGSMTIQMSGAALRNAAAEARRALLEMASERLDAATNELAVENGLVSVIHHPDRTISYAELMGGKRFNIEVTNNAPLKPPEHYKIVGTSAPRVDIPRKFTGQSSFVQDVRLPGMLHGRVVRPPSVGAELLSLDHQATGTLPGLVKVVMRGNFVGVVAEREEQAVQAAQQIKEQIKGEWRETQVLPRMEDLHESLRGQTTNDDILDQSGGVETALQQAAVRVHATYFQPYHAHASIGPSCAVADVTKQGVTIWSNTQGPNPLRGALAQLLNIPAEKIHLIHTEGAGSYGHNGADDVAADAAILSQAVGRPVRVQWSREDEFAWEPNAPAMVMEVQAGLDAEGQIVAWDYQVWSPSHAARPRFAGQLIAGQLVSQQQPPPTRFFLGGERNAPTNYTFPNHRVTIHWLPRSPLRVSSFRTLGGAGNTFANESFMDELAFAVHADAVEFRLRYLTDPRAREVLIAAAQKANWVTRPSASANEPGKKKGIVEGRGVAFAQYENDQAIVACVATIQVDLESGAVRVKRIVVAHDCGLVINPDGVKNQVEGNVIQSLSRALKEEVTFDTARITSVDWDSYPILKFSEIPDIDVVLINRLDQPSVGAGEPATVTTAAAVANAIFDATGVRLRQVPFTPTRVREALV